MNRFNLQLLLIALFSGIRIAGVSAGDPETLHKADVCVYGGTASGVMAAVAAAKEGADVIVVEPSRWLGGLTGGGISRLDWGRREAVGGSAGFICRGRSK